MKIKAKFSHIDLSSVVNTGKAEENASFFSKLKAKAADSTVKYAPSIAESVIEKKIKALISEHKLGIELETTVLLKNGNTGELSGIAFSVSKVDYPALFRSLKPLILKETAGKESGDIFSEILSIIGDDCDIVINSVTSSLGEDKKARIIGALVCRFNKDICAALNDAAKKKNIDVVIGRITVTP